MASTPRVTPRPTTLLLALTTLLVGCQSWQPIPAAERKQLARRDTTSTGVRIEAQVTVRSERLTGDFRCLMVADPGVTPRVRLQLYPDLGGKILDLVATDAQLIGFLADDSTRLQVAAGTAAPRHFLTFLALTLLERHRSITAESFIDRRDGSRGRWYRLQTGWPDHELQQLVTIDYTQRLHRYRYVSWTEVEELDTGVTRITANGLELSITLESSEADDQLPDALFELALPPVTQP